MLLSNLPVGKEATVNNINPSNLRQRLHEMGFVKGTRVRCLMRSPLGSPAAYLICGAIIALRDSDAATIEVFGDEN